MNIPPFKTEPYEDFSKPENQALMQAALNKVEKEFGKEYDLIIGGKHIKTAKKIKSYNPSNPAQIVGITQSATQAHAIQAIEAAHKAFKTWQYTTAEERVEMLLEAAAIMKRRKMELAATMILEAGKNWLEAIADVAEGIDFLEFYAREMMRLSKGHGVTEYPGEINEFRYIPLGVGVVIAPWNFPLAILAGMTVASVVTGNTVVVKPASTTGIIGAKFMEIMEEAGFPPGVVNFVTGEGHIMGDVLITHPKTRFINFTGSKDVGLHIVEEAAKIQPGQKWIKRVAAEMGGKDAIIVDSEADLTAAVEGTAVSAFGFQGQKCSACSRVIVDKKIYDKFVEMLVERTKKIKIGPVKEYGNYLGPVINDNAEKKILKYIEIGKKEAKLVTGGKKVNMPGHFIEPTIFINADAHSRIATEEIFGPVLTVIKANNLDHAIEIANDTEYGLTGGIFSKNREKIEQVKKRLYVGNLYINRKITGALVDIQPFGGYNMSGTCSKAGGRDYLILFLQGQSISERL